MTNKKDKYISKVFPYQNQGMEPTNKHTKSDLTLSILDDRHHICADASIILIVEDDLLFSKILLNSVRKKGFKGIVVNRGDLVIPYIDKYSPNAILLDIGLPKQDGWAILKELKSNECYVDIPVHIISNINKPQQGLKMGAEEYLVKPISNKQLNHTLNKIRGTIEHSISKALVIGQHHNKELLSQQKMELVMVENIEKASKLLFQQSIAIDCIIVDISIAKNKEIWRQVQQHPKYKNIPKIMLECGKSFETKWSLSQKYTPIKKIVKSNTTLQKKIKKANVFLEQLTSS